MLLLACALFCACSSTQENTPARRALTADEAVKLGDGLDPRADIVLGNIFHAPDMLLQLEGLSEKIRKSGGLPLAGSVRILNRSDIGLFVYPGGHIRLTRGLLALISSESEAAAAMALGVALDDVGAVSARLAFRVQDEGAVKKLLGGHDPDALEQVVAAIRAPDHGEMLAAADARALELLHAAGWSPEGLVKLLERLAGRKSDWLSAVPANPERIESVRAAASSLGRPEGAVDDTEAWSALRENLASVQSAYDLYDAGMQAFAREKYADALAQFEKATKYDDRQTPFLVAVGRARLALGRGTDAEGSFMAAVSLDEYYHTQQKQKKRPIVTAQFCEARYYTGEFYLAQQDFARAAQHLRIAQKYDPLDPRPPLRLGDLAEVERRRDEARTLYQDAIKLATKDSPVAAEAAARLEALR